MWRTLTFGVAERSARSWNVMVSFSGAAERSARPDMTEMLVLQCGVSETFVFNVAERSARSWNAMASFFWRRRAECTA